jgi:hypothetical protein
MLLLHATFQVPALLGNRLFYINATSIVFCTGCCAQTGSTGSVSKTGCFSGGEGTREYVYQGTRASGYQ